MTNIRNHVKMCGMGNVLLVDFMYLWNRVYYAQHASGGDYFRYVLDFMESLDRTEDWDKKYIILDGRTCSARHKALLPSYKHGRDSKTQVYSRVNELISRVTCKCSTLSFQRADNYEADEVIASWVRFLKDDYLHIYSGDKDLIQLTYYPNVAIGDGYTRLGDSLLFIPYTPKEMTSKVAKLSNGYFTDYKSILKFRVFRGDSSDKIPSAIPRLRAKDICTIIDKWNIKQPLSESVLDGIADEIEDEMLRDKVMEAKSNILRNYQLMNLIHVPYKTILKSVKVLSHKE